MAKKRISNQKINAGGIIFQKPAELALRTQPVDQMTALRLGDQDLQMEINVLTGPLLDVIQNATATRISYFPPEGQVMTENDRNLVGSLFLAGVEGDSALDTGSEITPLTDVNGTTMVVIPTWNVHTWHFPRNLSSNARRSCSTRHQITCQLSGAARTPACKPESCNGRK